MSQHLQYSITSWRQATKCLSNNNKDLHIKIADVISEPLLSGMRISVESNTFGTLFSTIINATGTMISNPGMHEMTTDEILIQLGKYGFDISYDEQAHLPIEQVEYLLTLQGLFYDKIRVLGVRIDGSADNAKPYLVAFKVAAHPMWLDNTRVVTKTEFQNALVDGTAINLTDISNTKHFKWDWLTYVADIEDIIADQENY